MKSFYTYIYIDPDNRQPFYVGKGTGNRFRCHVNNAHAWERGTHIVSAEAARKYEKILEIEQRGSKPDVVIVFESEKEIDALRMEEKIIKFFGRLDLGEGPLLNMNDGGRGGRRTFGTEIKEKMRQRMLGENNHMYGKTHGPEALRKMSERFKGKPGTPHSEEHKAKLRSDNPGGKATAKPVFQIDDCGTIIKEWPSANQAARFVGASKGNLCRTAKNGSTEKTKGYWWRFVGSNDVANGKLDVKKFSFPRGKGCEATHIETGEVRWWPSVLTAAKELNLRAPNIYSAIKYGRIQGGYTWK